MIRVTSTAALASRFAAARPPNPAPTMITCGRAAHAAARHEPQPGRIQRLIRPKAHASLPALAICRCRPERDRGVELLRMEGLSLESRRIAGKASEPPGAIKEPWGREAAPRLADGDGGDERAVGRRVLRHEMLQRLGHLMN